MLTQLYLSKKFTTQIKPSKIYLKSVQDLKNEW